MDNFGSLLDQPHLCVITRHADYELARIQDTMERKALVGGRADLEELFSTLLECDQPRTPKTLDLIGHSTADCLLQLGDWVIEGTRPSVVSYFRGLADNEVLSRLGIYAIRLLGCSTATTPRARATIIALSDILGIEVFGMRDMLVATHFDAHGFVRDRQYMLACSDDLRRMPDDSPIAASPEIAERVRHPRLLDVDTLPSLPDAMMHEVTGWPVRRAGIDDAQMILGCIRRTEGAAMPGLLAAPICEVAFPASRPGEHFRMQMLLDYTFVRVYPDGDSRPGVVYPIDNPRAVARIVAMLQTMLPRTPAS